MYIKSPIGITKRLIRILVIAKTLKYNASSAKIDITYNANVFKEPIFLYLITT